MGSCCLPLSERRRHKMNNSALGVLWLPVLTSLPHSAPLTRSLSPSELGGSSPLLSQLRDVRSLESSLGRALCSHCSCETDPGCRHNCNHCGYQCGPCSCSSSLECKYNCDKCQSYTSSDTSGSSGISGNYGSSGSTSSTATSGDLSEKCSGLVSAD